MKNDQAQTAQNLTLTKILQNFRKTSPSQRKNEPLKVKFLCQAKKVTKMCQYPSPHSVKIGQEKDGVSDFTFLWSSSSTEIPYVIQGTPIALY